MFKPIKLKNLEIDTPIFAAPLAGITDEPYRKILRKCAPTAPLLTEMISCHALTHRHRNDLSTGNRRNWDEYGGPAGLIGAQIFGSDPAVMAEGAKILEGQGAAWIDINMGCPVPKVAQKAGAGAGLMRDIPLAAAIVASVVRAVKIPVTMKTRLGWDGHNLNGAEVVRAAINAGACMATIHGRTRAAGYAGVADWAGIEKIKSQISGVPIIFNGDIKTHKDLEHVAALGADGAMIGRGILGAPWLLGDLTNTEIRIPKIDLIMEHLQLTLGYYGVRAGVPLFRKHAAWYSAGMPGNAEFRTRVNQITDAHELEKVMVEFFKNKI